MQKVANPSPTSHTARSRLTEARDTASILDELENAAAAVEREIGGIQSDDQLEPLGDKPSLGMIHRHNQARLKQLVQRIESIHRSLL